MKTTVIIIFISIILSCNNAEFSSIYRANPPVDIKIILLTSSPYVGDYLLLFRSENTKNARFGGFFIFIGPTRDDVLQMVTKDDASYILGIIQGEDSAVYNKGIDTQIAVLFSDNADEISEITVDNQTYSISTRRDKLSVLSPGNWLAIRTYLYNSTSEEVMEDEMSSPGNPVEIDSLEKTTVFGL